MRPFDRSPQLLLAVSLLLITHAVAQNLPKLTDANSNTQANTASAAATSQNAATTNKATNTDSTQATNTNSAKAMNSDSSTTSQAAAKTTDAAALSGLPKLAQDNYPAPSVPPTADAPFMQKSTLPDGTVFICVGAALGFFGFLVLAWRGLVAWSIHRSVRRAAIAQSAKYSRVGDPRAHPSKSKGPYYHPGAGSTLSLDQLGALGAASGKSSGKHQSGHGSLFFSPTAGAGMQTPSSNRGSGYLPAGYYASGNSAPAGGSGMTHLGTGRDSIGLSNLGPQTHRYSRARSTGPSPPRSPSLPPSRGGESTYGGRLSTAGLTTHASNSSLNLPGANPQSRAPSAYLEDLFENHPPGTPPPEEHRRGSRGRF